MVDNIILNENIDKLNKLYITNNIKYEVNDEKSIDLYVDDFDEQEVIDNINEINRKLTQKSLIRNIENKEYHQILNNSVGKSKARIWSLRSSKCSQWLYKQIGYNIKNKYSMSNEIFSKISRLLYGLNVVPRNVDDNLLICSKCGVKMDIYGCHALECVMGKGPTWRHNEMNKYMVKLIGEITSNYKLEPPKLDSDSKQRPDIIIHDQIEYKKGKFAPIYIDTMITDVCTMENVNEVNNNEFTIFNAGRLAKKHKERLYMNRYPELIEKGYKFVPAIFESSGGINVELRNILNYFLQKKITSN